MGLFKALPWPALKRRWPWALGVCALLALLFGNSGFRALARNWLEWRSLRGEKARLQESEAELQKRINLLDKDDAYLEGVARRDLGMMRPNETEYRFDPKGAR